MELKIQSLSNIQEQEEEEEEREDEEEKEEEKHFHVLAVDDSVLDRKILERLLRISSYKVTCVESGDKALQYLGLLDNLQTTPSPSSSSSSATSSPSSSPQLSNVEGLKVNLIMTDYCMPGMNGYDLLRRIKGSTWKDVPVIVMSSENVPARVTMCLEGGAEEFLLKPLQLSDLDKLQPHLLKSLNQPTPAQTRAPAGKDNAVAVKSGNNVSKRKAMSPKPSGPDRRPKMKELTVV